MEFAQLKLRLITASVLIVLALASGITAVYVPSSAWTMTALAFIAIGMSSVEFARMTSSERRDWVGSTNLFLLVFLPTFVLVLLGMKTIITAAEENLLREFLLVNWLALVLCLAAAFYSARLILEKAVESFRDHLVGYLLLVLGGSSIVYLTVLPHAPAILLWFLLVVCWNDAAAYFGGSKLGGPKVAPAISPKKTVSGCICGVVVGVVVGVFSSSLLPGTVTLSYVILLGLIVTISAQIGDFLKSLVKRSYGVKDSGSILPGHGGILDRVDGVLMAAPVILAHCLMVGG